MINDIVKNKLDYTILALISLGYGLLFLTNQLQTQFLLILTLGFGLLYFCWGVVHHLRTKSLHRKVVLEYLLVSLMAIILVSTLLI